MAALLLHIQDTDISLYDGHDRLAASPGIAVMDGTHPVFGDEANSRIKVSPTWTQTRFWQDLSQKEVRSKAGEVWTHADLAHEQLRALVERADAGGRQAIVAAPGHYDLDSLSLLLGNDAFKSQLLHVPSAEH